MFNLRNTITMVQDIIEMIFTCMKVGVYVIYPRCYEVEQSKPQGMTYITDSNVPM